MRSRRKDAKLTQTVVRIPDRWILLPAGDLVDLINGRAFKPSDWTASGLPIVRIQNLNNPKAPYNHYQGEVSDGHRIKNGDMLLSWSGTPGTSFGAFIWGGGEAVLNQHIFKVIIFSRYLDKDFLRIAINARLDALIASARGGVGLKHVTKGQVEALQIPCPPLEEQKRIVAKVDELMGICDKLEAQHHERKRLFPALSRACTIGLSDSPTPASLNRLFDDFGKLIAADLRELVLTLAIQGGLSKPGKGAKAKSNGSVIRLFPIPIDWEWRLLESVISIKHGHAFKSDFFTDHPQKHVLTTPGNFFESGGFRDRGPKTKYYTGPVPEEFVLGAGDLIIPMTEQAAGLLGSPAFIPEDGKTYLHNQRLGKITPMSETITRDYLACFFNSSFFRERVGETASGMKVRHTSPKKILQIPIPVPPHEEQQNIVARVKELTGLVDRLDAQQHECDELAEDFAKFTVAAITGATTQESDPMKAPKTELITKLQIGSKPKAGDDARLAKLTAKSKDGITAKALWQQSGLEIDAFYHKLKTEMAQGWIVEPEKAVMKEVEAN